MALSDLSNDEVSAHALTDMLMAASSISFLARFVSINPLWLVCNKRIIVFLRPANQRRIGSPGHA